MKKLGILTILLFVSLILNAQETKSVDTYKIAFFSKEATGVFKEMTGKVTTSESAKADSILGLKFDLSIKVASISTSNGTQTRHAKSSEWFHAEKYPTIDFVSSSVYRSEEGVFADGSLTIHGVTKEVSIPISIETKNEKTTYIADFSVNRMDYKLGPDDKVSRNIKIKAGIIVKK